MVIEEDSRSRLAEALLRTAQEDRAAFREVYRLSSARLFGICLRICGERQAAEDVLQDVYLTVWKRAGGYEPGPASPLAWLATIARNRAIDWRRAHGRHRASPIEEQPVLVDDAPIASTVVEDAQESHRLGRCLDELEGRSRDAIRTAFFDGCTYAELADRSAVPLSTMKTWIRRGLIRLKDCMER
ncbi:RNA polymerase sigma factor (sigma-70 family) [Sphingomonas sp. SORGH_AS870]|uniref:sigma-70 family RNA polymerase sigma factor n=1 Tax=Sphingomonas sp. SORGH_AS_0870 TaxID=3041801 RepID=UPI002865A0A2|nr:sigma-70 family RNA polymerase sigma factor [Sphingomonas sp. SORGH_AS_0870]MDR6146020.1 RNA polymerase sigma factor (sigma-70 family) [Sphingomonas sp. SORGH_AS_0870]